MTTCGSLIQAEIIKWIIPNFFEMIENNGQCIFSPHFPVTNIEKRVGSLCFGLFPKGQYEISKDFVSIGIANPSVTSLIIMDYVIGVEDINGNRIEQVFMKSQEYMPEIAIMIHTFVKRDYLQEELKKSGGSLIVTVEFKNQDLSLQNLSSHKIFSFLLEMDNFLISRFSARAKYLNAIGLCWHKVIKIILPDLREGRKKLSIRT